MNDLSSLTTDEIIRLLTEAHTGLSDSRLPPGMLVEPLKAAAVLIPMLRRDDQWHLLYIRRTMNVHDPHSGQIAFPGGASDESDDSPEETALREAEEEIGLHPAGVHILGCLDDFKTVTSFCVTPVVGTIPWPYPIRLEAKEVSKAFTIPLAWLARPENHQVQFRQLPPPYDPVPVIYFHPYDGEILWGATAAFTIKLITILSGENPR